MVGLTAHPQDPPGLGGDGVAEVYKLDGEGEGQGQGVRLVVKPEEGAEREEEPGRDPAVALCPRVLIEPCSTP